MKKHYLSILLLVFTLANAEITNPGLGSIFMSQSTPNTLNIVSTGGIHTMLIGSHVESDVGPSFAPDYSIQGPDGTLYGGSSSSGTLVKYDIAGHTTVLHTFSSASDAGTIPTGLIYRNGYIYGEVSDINSKYIGSLWKVAVDGSNYTILHQFTNNGDGFMPTGLMIMDDQGNIYGSTYSSLYRIDNNDNITFLTTQFPTFDLVYRGGYLYGSAMDSSGYGFLYKLQSTADDVLDPNTTVDIHDFSSADVMSVPQMLVLGANGKIYGTADDGYSVGRGGFGHIFSIDESDNVNPEYGFHGYSDGADPIAIVFESNGTTLHGVTRVGGPDGLGAVFTLETAIANKPESYINFVTEYLPRNEYQFGPNILIMASGEIKCMPSGTFYRVQESQAIACPSPNDNAVYFGRNVSNIPTQDNYIAGAALVQQTPIDDNNVAPTISTPLFNQQSMLVTNVDKYDVLTIYDANKMYIINQKLGGILSSNSLNQIKLLSPEHKKAFIKQFANKVSNAMAGLKDNDGDTYGVTRYLNNAFSSGGAGINNQTSVPLYAMCIPENKLFLVPAGQSLYCQKPEASDDLNTTGIYIGYNLPYDPTTGSVDITAPNILSHTIDYARGSDFGTEMQQNVWGNLTSGHSILLNNVSNFEQIKITGTPDGAITTPHCPDTTTFDGSTCQLGVLSEDYGTVPLNESGRAFADVGTRDNSGVKNWMQLSQSTGFFDQYGVYSLFSTTGYNLHASISYNHGGGCFSCSTYDLVTVTADPVYGNVLFGKIPPLYIEDKTNNQSGINTLCEPSNVPIHGLPNQNVIAKYSTGKAWILSIMSALTSAVLFSILFIALLVFANLIFFLDPAVYYLMAAVVVISLAVGAVSGVSTYNSTIVSDVSLPAIGGLCYASDQKVYEGTFDPASAAVLGESALKEYGKESLKYFSTIDMNNQSTFDGSAYATPNSDSYLEEIINYNNLATKIIEKDPSGNGIYYKGY